MNSNKINERSLVKLSRTYLIIPIIILVFIIIGAATLLVLYVLIKDFAFIWALIPFTVVSGTTYAFVVFRINKLIRRNFFDELYQVTYENLKKLNRDEADLNDYSQVQFKEIKELNDMVAIVRDRYSNGRLICTTPSYDSLTLKYEDKNRNLVEYNSFKDNIANIIYISQCFRNTLIEVYYDLKHASLSEENKKTLLDLYSGIFKDCVNPLYSFSSAGNSLLIYLPVTDSIERIKEQLIQSLDYASISVATIRGVQIAHPRFNVVIYPFSSEEYIFNDLEYVRRLKKIFNIYLPDRLRSNFDSKPVITTSMNLNYMSKALSLLSNIDYSSKDRDINIDLLKEIFNELSHYLNVSNAGVIYTDPATLKHKLLFQTDMSDTFDKNMVFSDSFMSAFDTGVDSDDTIYFSNRNSMPLNIGRELDYFNVSSGYFHVIRDERGNADSLIFFFNTNGQTLYLDSYIRETLFIIAIRIANYFASVKMLDYVDLKESEAESVLSLDSKHSLYRVDDRMNLTYMSTYLKKLFPHAKIGEPCYKALFGLDKMCPDCPMKQFKKRTLQIGKNRYELSLTLNDRKTHERALLLSLLDAKSMKSDYFDNNLLCYSNYALVNLLRNEYEQKGRGYILLLSLDNYEDFLNSQGSEGLSFATRCLIKNIKDKLNTNDIYVYNPTTIAIHFPLIGHIDIMTKCEQIFDLSKQHYFDDGSLDQFTITYLPISYPRGYADANDLMRHMSEVYRNEEFLHGRDFIYFPNHPIQRSASKREHIKEIINKEFYGLSPQSLRLQPFVTASDGMIFGAEVLLRITDLYSNAILNAAEVTRIAREENMTHVLTESIVNFIGNLYAEYGDGILRKNKFSRFSINVDNTFFDDTKFIETISKIMKDNNLPKYCISFEIPEDIVADNIAQVKTFSKVLDSHNIYLSCDRFKNNIISIERLHELGFNEVKIVRDLIVDMEKDINKVDTIRKIVAECKKYNIRVACVGVENEAQFRILKSLDPDMLVQGYYAYKPLTRGDFIAALMSYEQK